MKAFLLVGLVAPGLLATTLVKADLAALTRSSDAVVVGRVLSVKSRFSQDRARILTDSEIAVSQTLKGQVAPTLVVMQPGGEVGEVGQRVAGVARFAVGEEVAVFLEKRGERYFVVGLAQGKWRVERSSDGKAAFAVPPAELDAELVNPVTRQPVRADATPLTLEAFAQAVVTAAGQVAPSTAPTPRLETRP